MTRNAVLSFSICVNSKASFEGMKQKFRMLTPAAWNKINAHCIRISGQRFLAL